MGSFQVLDSSGKLKVTDQSSGSWTPVLGGSGGTSGQTYSTQVGRYVRRGNECTVWGTMEFSGAGGAKGTITGNLEIQGLPFTSSSVTGYFALGPINWFLNTALVFCQGRIGAGVTVASIRALTAAGTVPGALTTADVTDSSAIVFTATYYLGS